MDCHRVYWGIDNGFFQGSSCKNYVLEPSNDHHLNSAKMAINPQFPKLIFRGNIIIYLQNIQPQRPDLISLSRNSRKVLCGREESQVVIVG